MNDDLKKKWDQASAKPGTKIPVGDTVVCDCCSEDWTTRPESGGFIFTSRAYCPKCAKEHLPKIHGYREEKFIRAVCPPGVSFADFVRGYRGPDACIQFIKP